MGHFGPFSAVLGYSNPIYFPLRHKKWSQISPGGPLGLVLAKKICPTFISSLLGGEKSRFGPLRTIFGHSNPIYFALRHKKWSQISPRGPLAGASMKYFQNRLFIFGGNNILTRENLLRANQKLIFINLEEETAVLQDPEPGLAKKTGIFGSSIHTFGDHTAIILGGYLAKAGTTAGRSNFILTAKDVKAPSCDLPNCKVGGMIVCSGNPLMVECKNCKKFVHIFICGKYKGKKPPKKDSYKCINCSK